MAPGAAEPVFEGGLVAPPGRRDLHAHPRIGGLSGEEAALLPVQLTGSAPPVAAGEVQGLRFSHNIYINLPDTTDVDVFNAIFKAMKESLLS